MKSFATRSKAAADLIDRLLQARSLELGRSRQQRSSTAPAHEEDHRRMIFLPTSTISNCIPSASNLLGI